MSLAQAYHQYGDGNGPFRGGGDSISYWNKNYDTSASTAFAGNHSSQYGGSFGHMRNYGNTLDYSGYGGEYNNCYSSYNYNDYYAKPEGAPSALKKRKIASSNGDDAGRAYKKPSAYDKVPYQNSRMNWNLPSDDYNVYNLAPTRYDSHDNISTVAPANVSDANQHCSSSRKRQRSLFEDSDDEVLFLSRDQIERFSPSRKDGIDALHETRLRYSYCAFLQNLGLQLELPQTTIATAMVLCHRFFVRKSHACHDRYIIATASIFLAAKSEETSRPLYNVLRTSCEILENKDFTVLTFAHPVDWFEKYRERVLEAEEMILSTLNFELTVQHPYESLTSTLEKLGFAEPLLLNLALGFVSQGLRSSLWLQFKPQQIAAGAAYLAAKFLYMDLSSSHAIWKEFETPPNVLKDIAQQLMELQYLQ